MSTANEFRAAVEPQGDDLPHGQRLQAVKVDPIQPCGCGCGRTAAVGVHWSKGYLVITRRADVLLLTEMLRIAMDQAWPEEPS